jgi:DNA-binding MarR family transcriptional regulator
MNLKEEIQEKAKRLLFEVGYKKADKAVTTYSMIPIEMIHDENITKSELRVYAEILKRSGELGYTWVSSNYIAKELSVSRRTVDKGLKKLREKKYIISETIRKENNMEIRVIVPTLGVYFITNYTKLFLCKPGESGPSGPTKLVSTVLPKGYQDKEKIKGKGSRSTSTTTFSKTTSTGDKLHTTKLNLESKKIYQAYLDKVDNSYVIQSKDIESMNNFKHADLLVKYIDYWKNYINPKYSGSYDPRSKRLDDFDIKHTAKIHVMLKHWNSFKAYAKDKVDILEYKNNQEKIKLWENNIDNNFDTLIDILEKKGYIYNNLLKGIPTSNQYLAIYILLDTFGISVPDDYYETDDWTYDKTKNKLKENMGYKTL